MDEKHIEAERAKFEAYFAASRRSRGAGKGPTFARLGDGTYAEDHTQRHWWTWQQALAHATQASAPADHSVTVTEMVAPADTTVEPNSQEWAGMDGVTAWILINRHADNWADIGMMMDEWLAANRPAPAAQQAPAGWLPIETAPKDETVIVGFWPPRVGPVNSGCYATTMFAEGRWCNPEDSDDFYVEPPYWMPLPEIPKESEHG